ncbi:carboxylate-amine ligase [Thiovibrio sp. JS02]
MGVTTAAAGSLFQAYGLELEYMLVNGESLDVAPVADEVLRLEAGTLANEVEKGIMAWSNELALHVIEIKNSGPVAALPGLAAKFQEQVTAIRAVAASLGVTLLPTAMHPWMDPHLETRLWPHGNRDIYNTYDRIFNCQGHGWSNLQSTHLNLGFGGDEEFGRLHAAIRLLLPLMPALAASSPVCAGQTTGLMDTRLNHYRANQRSIPSLTARVIPEPVFTEAEYERVIYQRISADIAPLDPEGVLEAVWLNSRGAIARFDRNAIEIRVLDIQECPLADVAIAVLLSAVLKGLVGERWSSWPEQKKAQVGPLAELFEKTIASGEETVLADGDYLRFFGLNDRERLTAGELWQELAAACRADLVEAGPAVVGAAEAILSHGPLARRILQAAGPAPARERLREVYRELASCLAQGRLFLP